MATVASLNIKINAQSRSFVAGMQKAQRTVTNLQEKVSSAGSAMAGKFVGALAAAAAAGLSFRAAINAIGDSLERIDKLAKVGSRLGIDPNQLQALRLAAAELSGMEESKVDNAIQRMTRNIADAAKGGGEFVGTLKDLGLNAKELSKLTPDQQFAKLAEAMQGVTTQGESVLIALKAFGREGIELVQTLQAGPNVVKDYEKAVDDLGLTLTGPQRKAVEAFNDTLGRVKLAFIGIAQQVTAALAPSLLTMAQLFLGAIPGPEGVGNAIEQMGKFIETALPAAISLVNIFASRLEFLAGAASLAVGTIIQGFGKVEQFLNRFRSKPIGLDLSNVGKQMEEFGKNAIDSSFERFADSVDGTIAGRVRDALEKVKADLAKTGDEARMSLVPPLEEAAEAAEMAAKAVEQQRKGSMDLQNIQARPSVGAVTRRSTAGFSAIQQGKAQLDRLTEIKRNSDRQKKLLEEQIDAIELGNDQLIFIDEKLDSFEVVDI